MPFFFFFLTTAKIGILTAQENEVLCSGNSYKCRQRCELSQPYSASIPQSPPEKLLSAVRVFFFTEIIQVLYSPVRQPASTDWLMMTGCSGIYLAATWPPPHFVEAVGPMSDSNMIFCHNCLKLDLNQGPGDERQDFSLLRCSVYPSYSVCFSLHTF